MTGQVLTSCLAKKHSSSFAPSTGMSSQEEWLATYSVRAPRAGVPTTCTFSPMHQQKAV